MQVKDQKRSFTDVLLFRHAKRFVEFLNPLKAAVCSRVKIDKLDWDNFDFQITRVSEYTRKLDGRIYVFTDYDMVAKELGKDPKKLKLRVIPEQNRETNEFGLNTVLMLEPEDQMGPQDENFEDVCAVIADAQKNKLWEVDLEGEEDGLAAGEKMHIEYERCNGVGNAMESNVAILEDTNNDGKFDPDEITQRHVMYWDFQRAIEKEGGVIDTEFFIVEQDKSSRYITMWRGTMVSQERISVI